MRAVDNVDLEVGEGEFFTLLGPSGCGKTTLLRMIAGFCELDAGEIRFGERRIDRLPAHLRDIGMVFQNYAVFPNLTVAGNVAYGLEGAPGGGGRDRRAGSRRRWHWSSSPATASAGRTSSRAASCSAWRSPALW